MPPEPGRCSLLVGPAAISAQVLLAFVALGALLLKRYAAAACVQSQSAPQVLCARRQREQPQRPLAIWSMDVAKQVTSSVVAHMAGRQPAGGSIFSQLALTAVCLQASWWLLGWPVLLCRSVHGVPTLVMCLPARSSA